MAQPHTGADLPLSDSILRPSFSEPASFTFNTPQQALFTQRLIPRDFLGARNKNTHEAVPNPHEDNLESTSSSNQLQSSQNFQNLQSLSVEGDHCESSVSSTEHCPPETTLQKYDLNVSKIRSINAVKPFTHTLKAKSTSFESPAIPQHSTCTDSAIMPRTSSIDSAVSHVSTILTSKMNGDVSEASPTSVRDLIATAGGAETLITHLLKDKNSIATQNVQLWKLVEKQRSLILGLNKDLERLNRERDRYKKRVKELEIQPVRGYEDIRSQVTPSPEKSLDSTELAADLERNIQSFTAASHINKAIPSGIASNSRDDVRTHAQHGSADQDKENNFVAQASKPILPEVYINKPDSPGLSLPKSKLQILNVGSPTLSRAEGSPLTERPSKSIASNRKAPPTPLKLTHDKVVEVVEEESATVSSQDNRDERGRRRTREDDDRDRAISAKKAEAEAEARSQSKKNKVPKLLTNDQVPTSVQTHIPAPLPTPGLPLSPRPQHAQAFAAAPTHLTIAGASQSSSLSERLLAAPLKSPGLPLSPRPANRFENASLNISLPLSPRANMGAFPLSPRAPKHALPMPTTLSAPTDTAALQQNQSRSYQPSPQTISSPADRLQVHSPVVSEPPPVFRGLAISAYPNLLLPPNALPSIQVKVHSSRLRPSRFGVPAIKSQDETLVFSLSVISRSSSSELWRIEKMPASLPQLEQTLRPFCSDLPRMPDRKLFASGQSPTVLDDRRTSVDNYFDELLDIHVNEQAAVAICRFLSTDIIDPEQQTRSASSAGSEMGVPSASPAGSVIKTGYLTKKGKNFGGWKSRFFILDGADLRYYESAGGPHSGTIRLQNALIGKQKEGDSVDDGEGQYQYRHAFLIQEPKRKDTGNYVRHVLCAESDQERDEWVTALLYWVEGGIPSQDTSRNGSTTSTSQDLNDSDNRYQNSKAGPSSKESRETHINTPTPTSGSSIDSSTLDYVGPSKPVNISGPTNGNVITDSSAWGSKAYTSASREIKDKTYKMGNIFGFKRPDPAVAQQEQKVAKPRILRHNGYVRAAFGIPLAEAVEFCAPFGIDIDLPAVVYRCIEYLQHKHAEQEEGLFRLSGSNVVVRNLKERFNTEGDVDLVREDEYHDIHAVASLFKTYLRELPSTLLTRDLHIQFIKVLELQSQADKVAMYHSLVNLLPPVNLALLKALSKYLLEVTQNSDTNKMSVRNMGIVFSPTLNIPTPVFTMFLAEYSAIFEQESNHESDTKTTEIIAPASLTPVDIRSPRHQMFTDLPTPAPHQTSFQNHMMPPPRGTMTGTGELGFVPIQAIYETGNYVPPAPTQSLSQVSDMGGFSSLNGLLAPTHGPNDRARKRQSMILS